MRNAHTHIISIKNNPKTPLNYYWQIKTTSDSLLFLPDNDVHNSSNKLYISLKFNPLIATKTLKKHTIDLHLRYFFVFGV